MLLPQTLNRKEDNMGIKRNVGGLDRILRIVGGSAVLVTWAFLARGNYLILGVGLFMLFLGLVGFCPLYVPFKISTRKRI